MEEQQENKKRKINPNSLANLRHDVGGRTKQPEEFKQLVRSNTVPALQAVINIMNDPKTKPNDRLKAAELIIDRAYGKAVQPIDADISGQVKHFILPPEVVGLLD